MAKKKQIDEYSSYKNSSKNPIDFLNHFRYEKYPVNSDDEFASEGVELLPDLDGQYVDYAAAVAAIKWAQELMTEQKTSGLYKLHLVLAPGIVEDTVYDNQTDAIKAMNFLMSSRLKPLKGSVWECAFVKGKLEDINCIAQSPYK